MKELLRLDIREKAFKDVAIFKGAEFVLHEGKSVAITGLSGAGKTTLLRMASGLDPHWTGALFFQGENIDKKKAFPTIRKKASFVFQSVDLIDSLNVEENVLLPFRFLKAKVDEKELDDLLACLSLSDKRGRLAKNLSLGERQRVAIARAFITHPEVVFADEPTGSLDDENTHAVMKLLLDLSKEKGATLFMVTHRRSLLPLFDEVYEIHDQKIEKKTL